MSVTVTRKLSVKASFQVTSALKVAVWVPLKLIRLPVNRDQEYVKGGTPDAITLAVPVAVPVVEVRPILKGLGDMDAAADGLPGPTAVTFRSAVAVLVAASVTVTRKLSVTLSL